MRLTFSLLFVLAVQGVVASSAAADRFPRPSVELCATYRQGPVVHDRIPVYYGRPSEDTNSFYWVDIWYRPEYLRGGVFAGLPRPDGLPERDLLFNINLADGQPVPPAVRRTVRPQEDGYFSVLLLGGLSHFPIDRIIDIYANWPPFQRERLGRGPQINWTGDFTSSFERILLPDARPELTQPEGYVPEVRDYYAERVGNEITALMSCTILGNRPVPHCEITEKTELFEMDISGFRRNQLPELDAIRAHAQNFSACLTLDED